MSVLASHSASVIFSAPNLPLQLGGSDGPNWLYCEHAPIEPVGARQLIERFPRADKSVDQLFDGQFRGTEPFQHQVDRCPVGRIAEPDPQRLEIQSNALDPFRQSQGVEVHCAENRRVEAE